MNVRGVCVAVLAMASGSSCGGDRTPPAPSAQAALGGEVAARVGPDVIPMSLVIKVATVQHITPREALRRLVDDAVTANAARARGLDRQLPTSWRLTAASGRLTADRLLSDAKLGGPPSDTEVAQLSARYWREVDRPPAIRVVHAVAMRNVKKPDPSADAMARAFAEQVREAVLSAKNGDEFQEKAKALPHPGVEVVVQPLTAFTREGVMSEGGEGSIDEAFVKASFALEGIGATSPVIESKFGWHVIRLEERVPEQRMPLEARRIAFTDEAYSLRASAATTALLTTPIAVAPSAEQLMRSLVDAAARGPTP
jgi:peptidyl-prolyl cis-trans isomerase C